MKKTCVPSVIAVALTVVLILALAACAGQPPAASPSHIRQVEGPATVTTVLEDFDQGKSAVALEPRVDAWGARIGATRSSIETVPGASPDGGAAARFVFDAAFGSPYVPGPSWEDSGLAFVSRVDLGTPPEASEGLSVRMKPEGFTVLELYLVQGRASKPNVYGLTVFATDGRWKEWKVRFASFSPMESAPPFDPARPVALEVYAPFDGNWNAFSFRKGTGAAGSLLVDDVGFWRSKVPVGPVLEGFDDERDLLPFGVDLYGSSVWVDYSKTDSGESKVNEGVRAQRLTLERRPGGAVGNALALEGRLEITPAIAELYRADQGLALFLKAPFGRPLGEARTISFRVRSDLVRGGSLEIQDEQNDAYYGASFDVGRGWERVVIRFDRLETKGGTLADADRVTDRPRLELAFELPRADVERAASSGVLGFTLWLDDFRLEP